MKNRQSLQEKLRAYGETDMYPFHMPGHKRNREWAERFSSPFSADITEIMGFDNLHRPEGILRDAMEDAAALYGARRTWFLVGGSTAGILAALSAAALPGEKILMASNCHRSAYHAAVLRDLMPIFVRPEISEEYGVSCAVRPEDVERILAGNAAECGGPEGRIRAVFLTSPTYEGVISDIRKIAETAHRFGVPLIVDEAHGAHLAFIGMAGESAVACGADLVIQSVHKTLPALTQTALLHLCRGGEKYFSPEALTRWLRVFESSSPSYILMESIDSCLRYMGSAEGARAAKDYMSRLSAHRASLEGLKHIRLFSAECADPSKLVLFPDRTLGMTGKDLADLLRLRYHLETEMACRDYVIAMTAVMDTEDAFRRLEEALYELDRELEEKLRKEDAAGIKSPEAAEDSFRAQAGEIPAERVRAARPAAAWNMPWEWVLLREAAGRTCGDFVTLYPPGVPMLLPGDRILPEDMERIREDINLGLSVDGVLESAEEIFVPVLPAERG